MGADRELVLLTGSPVILIFVVLTWYSALFGIAIWIVIVGAAADDGKGRSDDAEGLCAPYRLPASLPADLHALAEVLR
jgi:hypothetical protein